MTRADEHFQDAAGRADVARLAGLFDGRACPPAALGRLIRHRDARMRYLGLVLLGERVSPERAVGEGEGELSELAGLLLVAVPAAPEEALRLAALYGRLGPHLPAGRKWPAWRAAGLPMRVRTAWLRAELRCDPAVLRTESPGELLYQAVGETDLTDAHRPAELVAELVACGDPVLRAAGLRLARQGLHAGLLAPAMVRELLVGLLVMDSASGATGTVVAEVVAGALDELAQPWAALRPLPSGRLAACLTREAVTAQPAVAEAALTAAARHGHRGVLGQILHDPELPPGLRQRALELLGEVADRGEIPALTAFATRDALLFGGPAVTCLRGLHRRGHFPQGTDVPSIIGIALADHTIPAREVATVLFTCRQEMFQVLMAAAVDDPSWPRRLALLVALAGQGAAELRIGAAVTRMLPSAAAPRPFLDAIRALRHAEAEEAVIALLPSAPGASLATLEAIGGARTVAALREGLGLGEVRAEVQATAHGGGAAWEGTVVPHLRTVRRRAMELLWQLTDDPAARLALLAFLVRLDPADLPPGIVADLGGPDEQELALLGSQLDPARPGAVLCRLAAHGSASTVPVLAELLLRVVAELARPAPEPVRLAGGAPSHAGGAQTGEPVVSQEVLAALQDLGHRLHERRRIRPACLLDAANGEAAGHALVATMVLDLLDRPGLPDGEQAILLELLLRVPFPGTRARVHRLLRSRDRHVRKHVIALLARSTGGEEGTDSEGAQALSASLIVLTAAQDIQTVRQALLALGRARARWAAAAIARCLDHPNMNIKKTAAQALVRAGTPAVVPELLRWLGRHDNPGLRAQLIEALRAILGEAYLATLLAVAEESRERRAREMLLAGLDGMLSPRAIRALDEQASPVVPVLLALVVEGRVGLTVGTVEDLATTMARHGLTSPASQKPVVDCASDTDIRSLLAEGWNSSVAVRIAERTELPDPARLSELRPLLPDWLRLAGDRSTVRDRVLRLTLRFCAAPWTPEELAAFARSTGLLLDGLAATHGGEPAGRARRDDLVALLEAVAPLLSAVEKLSVAEAVRALPPGAGGQRSTLGLLRHCDAVLVRADLDQALDAAGRGANPWQAETAVLREAFGASASSAPASPQVPTWQAGLTNALRTPAALAEFRFGDHPTVDRNPGSRELLSALIDGYPAAGPGVRAALLDWLTELQPLDAPPWTLAEAARTPAPAPRAVQDGDLDQPRSAALRERLLTMLAADAPDRRQAAALALLEWPEPEIGPVVLRAFLHGRVDLPAHHALSRALTALDGRELRGDRVLHARVAQLAQRLDPDELAPLVPLLREWWEQDPPAVRAAIAAALREARCGTAELADDASSMSAPNPPSTAQRRPSRRESLELARTGAPDQIRRALTRLAEAHAGPDPDRDPALGELIRELLTHPRPRVRLHAHRTARAMLDRRTYLQHTALLLEDPQPDVVRTAIRTLCHAPWESAIPAVTGLLDHAHPVVRKAAADGLLLLGASAIPALRQAADHARPDRRSRYTVVLDQIATTAAPEG